MDNENNNSDLDKRKSGNINENEIPDFLTYPPSEDIYNQLKKESDIDPEDISIKKVPVEINNVTELNEKSFDEDMSGSDLDVPGSDLDDKDEAIGNEDEENNYYSIGGDDHNDLEEDQGGEI